MQKFKKMRHLLRRKLRFILGTMALFCALMLSPSLMQSANAASYTADLYYGNVTFCTSGTNNYVTYYASDGRHDVGITDSTTIIVTQTDYEDTSTSNRILIGSGDTDFAVNINVKLAGVNIDTSSNTSYGLCAFCIVDGFDANVYLTLQSGTTNTLQSADDNAGLQVTGDGNVTIQGTGTLYAYGGNYGAGIGGNDGNNAGHINIAGGKIFAYGGDSSDTDDINSGGAGIGGGRNGTGGTIYIYGGTVTANGGNSSAGIGGGCYASGGKITISSGTVNAVGGNGGDNIMTGYSGGAGIGGGYQGSGGTINISGGTVTATGGRTASEDNGGGAGIGGGGCGNGGTIGISGGTVRATGGGCGNNTNTNTSGAGLGGGGWGEGGTISISGGVVYAKRGEGVYAAYDIGSCRAHTSDIPDGGELTITDDAVIILINDDVNSTVSTSTHAHYSDVDTRLLGLNLTTNYNSVGVYIPSSMITNTTCKVTYDANNSTNNTTISSCDASDTIDLLSTTNFSLDGYYLANWNTKADGSGKTYALGASVQIFGDTTFYAVWERTSFDINYNANGGDGDTYTVTYTAQATITLSDGTAFSKDYYYLAGWCTTTDDSGKLYDVEDTLEITEDMTLYAVWAEIEVTSLTISDGAIALSTGNSYPLTVDVLPTDAYDQSITWNSADESIATVDEDGIVSAISNGYTTITGTHDALTVTCVVVVTDILYNYNLASGSTMTISATDYTSGSATWTSSDTAVATINDGLVTAVSQGYAEITVAVDGTSQTVGVVVYDQAVTSVVLSRSTASLIVDEVLQLQAIVSPDDAADSTVTWSSSDTAIAAVSTSGVVTAVSSGTATITATSGGQSDSCTITIMPITNADLSSLSLSTGSLAFSSAITDYYLTVGSDVTSIDLTASADDAKAVMLLDGTILSQGGTASIPLSVGDNTVEIMVIAQDATTKTYTVTINRGTSDATLSSLTLTDGMLSPSFDTATYAYTATVANAVTSLTVTPTATDNAATVTVNGQDASTDVSLSVGSNTVTVQVTGSDGVTTKTYTVTVTRQEEITITNTSLSIGIVGAAYSVTMAAEGGTDLFTWSATGLPDYLSLDSSTGVLSGTPELTDVGNLQRNHYRNR